MKKSYHNIKCIPVPIVKFKKNGLVLSVVDISCPLSEIKFPVEPRLFQFGHMLLNRYRRKRPKVDASIYDSALSHTCRVGKKRRK